MSYPQGAPGGQGFPPGQQPTTQFSAPTQQFNRVPDAEPAAEGPSKIPVYLSAAVAALGLLVYLSNFGPQFTVTASSFPGAGQMTSSSFGIIFAVIAAIVASLLATVGLLPRQRNFTAVVAVAAVLGLLLVLADVITKPAEASIGWGLYLVIAFLLLQAAVAVVGLLFDAGIVTPPAPRPKYEQPQSYGQYPGYYGQPPTQGGSGQHQQGPQQQRPGYPTPYGGYPGSGPGTGGFPAGGQSGPPTPPTGFPTYGQPPASNTPTSQAPAPHQSPSSSQPGQSSS